MRIVALTAVLMLAGCKGGRDTGDLLDTGWFSDVGDSGGCIDRVTEVSPTGGTDDWYWRSAPWAQAATVFQEAYELRVVDSFAAVTPGEQRWSGTAVRYDLGEPLQPLTDYVFEVTDCDGKEAVPFTTSDYGLPLTIPPAALKERTYVYDLTTADWVEPKDFGSVISLYFTNPILIGVQWATEDTVDLIGTMGGISTSGEFTQLSTLPTWNLPATDFNDRPYFAASADKITVRAEGVDIDLYDFEITGTFSADGSRIGGTTITGLGDTRNMGELIGQKGEPEALCELAATWSVICEPCPDGSSYCMRLTALGAEGTHVPDLSLRYVAEE